jgi:hypothetical protein
MKSFCVVLFFACLLAISVLIIQSAQAGVSVGVNLAPPAYAPVYVDPCPPPVYTPLPPSAYLYVPAPRPVYVYPYHHHSRPLVRVVVPGVSVRVGGR